MNPVNGEPDGMSWLVRVLLLAGMACGGSAAAAKLTFEDVTEVAGLRFVEPTAGAAWGDVNGDGRPDLWVGNHRVEGEGGRSNRPVLLINGADGRFSNEAPRRLRLPEGADPHGAAWADFDNDGDQDLVVLCGAGGGRTDNPNLLLVNDTGMLEDRAQDYGVAFGAGRGRTPLWLDADGDGLLDLLAVNKPRPDGRAPTTLFRNGGDGRFATRDTGLSKALAPWGLRARLRAAWNGLIDLDWRTRPPRLQAGDGFAVLAWIEGLGLGPGVVLFDRSSRLLRLEAGRFLDVTPQSDLPTIPGTITDAVVADLNGDGVADFAFARSLGEINDIVQPATNRIEALLTRRRTVDRKARLRFDSAGPIRVELEYVWRSPQRPPPRVRVGGRWYVFKDRRLGLELAPELARASVGPSVDTGEADVYIVHEDGRWTIATAMGHLGVRVSADQSIRNAEIVGIRPERKLAGPVILLSRGPAGGYRKLEWKLNRPEAVGCTSVVAGDFDNDMDLDLYFVCSGAVRNTANLLLVNDGRGRFRDRTWEAGAEGVESGRGDVVVVADYDLDGMLDLFITNGHGPPPFNQGGPYQLLRGRPNGNHWLEVDLVGTLSNRDGIGARVMVEAGERRQWRLRSGGTHSFSQNHKRLHFGLGRHDRVDRLVVHWPSGIRQVLEGLEVDRVLVIREPGA